MEHKLPHGKSSISQNFPIENVEQKKSSRGPGDASMKKGLTWKRADYTHNTTKKG